MTEWKRTIRGINVLIDEAAEGVLDNNEAIARVGDILAKQPDYADGDELAEGANVEFIELVDEMRWAREDESPVSTSYFDAMLGAMYDWADAERVWIEPVAMLPKT